QGRRLTELLGEVLDDRWQDTVRMRRDRRRALQRPPPGPGGGGGLGVHAVLPASTVRTVPVMLLAFGPSRNSTASATSSTSANRRRALRRATCSRLSPSRPRVISVSRNPGATAFTLTRSEERRVGKR